MNNMIRDLENQILDQIINEGKDPVDASIKEQIAEWKNMKKKMAVIDKISKAVGARISELEKGFDELVKGIDGHKTVIDGAILEYTQKKSNTTVKYKEVVDYALKMINEAQQKVLKEFITSVTKPGEFSDVLAVTDPELEQFLLQLKDLDGEELMAKIETMARAGFEKLPRQVANAKKRELKEGVIKNVAKVIANLARTFATKFKAVFKANDQFGKAAEALVKAVKSPINEDLVTEDQNYTDFGQWQSACKQGRDNVWFDGDEKECSAYQGEQPFTQGQTTLVGSWNGKSGTSQAPAQSEALVLEKSASAWERLDTLKKEFRTLGDEIDARVKAGEDVTLEDKTIKKMVKIRDKMGPLNKKLGIPRPGDIK